MESLHTFSVSNYRKNGRHSGAVENADGDVVPPADLVDANDELRDDISQDEYQESHPGFSEASDSDDIEVSLNHDIDRQNRWDEYYDHILDSAGSAVLAEIRTNQALGERPELPKEDNPSYSSVLHIGNQAIESILQSNLQSQLAAVDTIAGLSERQKETERQRLVAISAAHRANSGKRA